MVPHDTIDKVDLLSPQGFARQLIRERSRCDRTGEAFSVVRFLPIVESEDPPVLPLQSLLYVLRSRLRASDWLGWNEGQIVAAILTATDRAGAERYTKDLLLRLGEMGSYYRAEIRSYPEVAKLRHGGDGTHLTFADPDLARALSRSIPSWKRCLDILGAAVGLVVFAPLFLLFPLYVKMVSPGPVFFRQDRVGYRGRLFTFLKFRTMHADNSVGSHKKHLASLIKGDASMLKLDDARDPRIIPGGRILRNSSLDEVPQFWNVLRGEMTLVGPRPCIPYEAEEYLRWHSHRFDVLPGMSGLWQVSGKNRLSFKEMIRLDIAYTRRMSLWLDLKIIALTFPSIVWEGYLKLRGKIEARRLRSPYENPTETREETV